jgi:molecular chaperone Hsp33
MNSSFTTDTLTKFLLPKAGLRGVHVNLEQTWQTIQERGHYSDAVSSVLGEFCAAASLFTGHIKVNGRLSIQARGNGEVGTLFAECTSDGAIRAIARADNFNEQILSPQSLGEGAVLAITIETLAPGARDVQRYQGLVGLDAPNFSEAFEGYFSQSEQLPTRLFLAVSNQRTVGMLIQQLPEEHRDADGWNRVHALMETLGRDEFLSTEATTLLWRLFNEEDVQLNGQQALEFACSCSRERVSEVLTSLGQDEALSSLENGLCEVHCEFCGQNYQFNEAQILDLFLPQSTAPGSERLN